MLFVLVGRIEGAMTVQLYTMSDLGQKLVGIDCALFGMVGSLEDQHDGSAVVV